MNAPNEELIFDFSECVADPQSNARQEFIHAALRDVTLFAYFAPKVTDHSNPADSGKINKPKRFQRVSECMAGSLDYTGGPSSVELMQMLADAARGEDIRPAALNLVKRMAATWAERNEVVA